jgi:hypothetical protein
MEAHNTSLPTHIAHYVTASRTTRIRTGRYVGPSKSSPPALPLVSVELKVESLRSDTTRRSVRQNTRKRSFNGNSKGESVLWNLLVRLHFALLLQEFSTRPIWSLELISCL